MKIYKNCLFKEGCPHSLGSYLIQGPFHPFWDHWLISIVDLKDDTEGEPANKHFPEATHEISIVAYQNVKMLVVDNTLTEFEGDWLQPIDLAQQIKAGSDEKAIKAFEKFINVFRGGGTSPDSSYRHRNSFLINTIVNEIEMGKGLGL